MSREILFKAKQKNWRELPKEEWWVEGWVFDDGMIKSKHYFIGNIVIEPYGNADNDAWDVTGEDFYEIDPETLCQYTGLKKYAEKDIIKRTDLHKVKEPSIGIIEYDVENAAFVIHWIDKPAYSPMYPWKDRIKVIGNIFDNPELLKEE